MTSRQQDIQAVYEEIYEQGMRDLPVVNTALNVSVTSIEQCESGAVCVLVTPWCMNLMLFPKQIPDTARTGVKACFKLPSGDYEFVYGFEKALGGFYSCSLFSPVFQFKDQTTIEATAKAALLSVLADSKAPVEIDSQALQARVQENETIISRRNFLRGGFRS